MGFQAEGVDGLRLSPDVRRHAYLVFKEALNNAARHADASRVDVALSVRSGRLVLRVADDGRGFDPSRATEGNGLTTMTRRAAELGGRTEIASPPGGGTSVTLDVPLGR
jgi:signal transduction histidine kinase